MKKLYVLFFTKLLLPVSFILLANLYCLGQDVTHNLFPASGFSTLAFEDLWPSQGDYDMNDIIVDCNFDQITDNQTNKVTQIQAQFVLRAMGASFHNGFGIQLPVTPDKVSSCVVKFNNGEEIPLSRLVSKDSKGLELGQDKAVVILFDDGFLVLPQKYPGIGVNTALANPWTETRVINMTITFSEPIDPNLLVAPYNPFIFTNSNRGIEVHLPNNVPTSLANKSLFKTQEDDSKVSTFNSPSTIRSYLTKGNLPWAIFFYKRFDYPIEKAAIIEAYHHLAEWAQSGGSSYPDWYFNLASGYRDDSKIYLHVQNLAGLSVSTSSITNITLSTANAGGNVTDDGGSIVTARGVCWGTSVSPTIAGSKTTDGVGLGSFTSNLTGLNANTTYYVRAYATTNSGTIYGAQVNFTSSPEAPKLSITTASITNITSATATSGGNISNEGGVNVTARGVCWSTTENPTTANSKTTDGTGSGSFISNLTELSGSTIYYVRAYATNSFGTAYGTQQTFTTQKSLTPTVSTNQVYNNTSTTAISGGQITDDGGTSVTARGVCWSTSENPKITNSKTSDGAGVGSFDSNITGLTINTTYYIRAYATNSFGTAYGNQIVFTTPNNSPIIFNPNLSYGSVTDIDGNVYKTITIGTQTWMAENLRTTKFNEGSAIPLISSAAGWNQSSSPGYSFYSNDETYKNIYGAYYNGYAVNTGMLCPVGWHVPSDDDWKILIDYLGGDALAGAKLKETGTGHWLSPNYGATNESGFTGLPGCFVNSGKFYNIGITGNWWGSTGNSGSAYWSSHLANNNAYTNICIGYNGYSNNNFAYPIRCIMGDISKSVPILTTFSANDVTVTSAIIQGNVTSQVNTPVTVRGVCWSTAQNPTIADAKTTDGTGDGYFSSKLTSLTALTTYYVRTYATNSFGTGYGPQQTFTTLSNSAINFNPALTYGTVTDVEGNIYKTITIGTQTWMAQNLRTTKYRNGDPIPTTTPANKIIAGENTPKYQWSYEGDESNVSIYGRLYTWYAATDPRSICPIGWHLPSVAEASVLISFLGGGYGAPDKMKETGSTNHWLRPNTGYTNESGFTALPVGCKLNSDFTGLGVAGYFWLSNNIDATRAYQMMLYYYYNYGDMFTNLSSYYGSSIRCIKDDVPLLSTNSPTNITSKSVIIGGAVSSDGGSLVTSRGVCWSTSPNPTITDFKTTDGTGIGSFTSKLTGLTASTTYYVRGYATNSAGTNYGDQQTFTTLSNGPINFNPNLIYGTVTDIDNNVYRTITIGTQTWMAENLKTTRYRNGDLIGTTTPATVDISREIYPKYQWSSDGDESNVSNYGRLYTWWAATDPRGLCPVGWHIPTSLEAAILINFLGGENYAGGKMKETGSTNHWLSPSTVATNESGFTALPSGIKNTSEFSEFGTSGFYWLSDNRDGSTAYIISNHNYDNCSYLNRVLNFYYGLSIRCVKDDATNTLPVVNTTSPSVITSTYATSGGGVNIQGNTAVTSRGVCWSTAQNPTIADSKTTDGSGLGTFTSKLTGLAAKTTYYLRAYATNSFGTAYGEQQTLTTLSNSPINFNNNLTYGTVTDVDGNSYRTIRIGTQTWMAENLKTTKYRNGESILITTPATANISQENSPKYQWVYDGDEGNVSIYGRLYTWYAATDSRGLCPTGWHLPSSVEATILINFLGGEYNAGGKMKEAGLTHHWLSPNTGATNESGLTTLPGGYRSYTDFNELGTSGVFWLSNNYSTTSAYIMKNYYNGYYPLQNQVYSCYNGLSVRAIKDDVPSINTILISNLSSTSAISGGNILTDVGSAVTARGVCWSTSPNPTTANFRTADGTGIGSYKSIITGLASNTTYYVRAYATNSLGTSYGSEVSFTTPLAENPTGTFTDSRDNKTYKWVQIGTQTWMAENLAYLPFVEYVNNSSETLPYYYVYLFPGGTVSDAKATANYQTYGVLYNWQAAKIACPQGWHLPSEVEWSVLEQYLGRTNPGTGNSGYIGEQLKSSSGWSNDGNGINTSGFNAFPGGSIQSGGFYNEGRLAYFWTSTPYSSTYAWTRYLYDTSSDVTHQVYNRSTGMSVRCVKD